MEVWSSSDTELNERESSISQDEEDEDGQEQSTSSLCRELVKVLCSERVGKVTKTYHDIEAVTHLLEEKERDLELAARIGQSLLKQNKALTERNELLDQQLEVAKEEIAQLRHELSMRDDLLQLYASTEETEAARESRSPIRRNESRSSLSNYVHYDFLQKKLRSLEDENLQLRATADEFLSETNSYEEQEQQLMMVCVEELSSANKQVVDLSEELARKVDDSSRQQEEISCLLGQIVDLQQRCKVLIKDSEDLTQNLNTSRESQFQLKTELKELQERYSECEDMLREAREEIKNLRNKSLPNSTVQRYSSLAAVFPMESLAAEIEGTFRKGLDSPAPPEYRTHPWRVFETVRVANQAARLRSRCHSPQAPSSSPASSQTSRNSTPRTSYYGSDSVSLGLEDKPQTTPVQEQSLVESKRLGQPGMPGGQDLEKALRFLSSRQESQSSDWSFFELERERKLRARRGSSKEGSSGFLTPNDSLASTGTNYSGSSQHSAATSSSQSCLPERLQIVKPLEGSVTLHHWQQLATPNLAGILHPRPGIITKDFKELDVDIQQVYSLNDLEEDEPNWSKLPIVTSSGANILQTCPAQTITNSQILHPPVLLSSLNTSLQPHELSTSGSAEHVKTVADRQRGFFYPPATHKALNLGLIQLLQERGIAASTQPSDPPILRPPTSTLAALNNKETDGRHREKNQQRRDIFSFNLVDKLHSLGLHKMIARGFTDSGKEERRSTPSFKKTFNTGFQ